MDELRIPDSVKQFLRAALEEDIGPGDLTTDAIIPAGKTSKARLIAKSETVVAGMPFVRETFRLLSPHGVSITELSAEGSLVKPGAEIALIEGETRLLLMGERVALNVLQRLCGVATITRAFASRLEGLKTKVLDTRKTTPCMRFMEKYAVRTGGGQNHRFGLFDGILIKDNHIAAAGGIANAVALARKAHRLARIEVETENPAQVAEALEAGADVIMLDNMKPAEIREVVAMIAGRAETEASGNITLENIRAYAEAGVDYVSSGSLTHSAAAADISMRISL